MIKVLSELQDAVELNDITPEMWAEWEALKVTKHFKQFILGEMIKSIDCLVEGEQVKFCRGELNAFDQTLSYIPRNINV